MVDVNGLADKDTYDVYLSDTTLDSAGADYIVSVHDGGLAGESNALNLHAPLTQTNDLIVRAGFVALVHPATGGGATGPYAANYERINYDASAALNLFCGNLGDHFFFIDNGTVTTVNAGSGDNTFQFGALFGSLQQPSSGTVAPGDAVSTVNTTSGYLSRGVSFATTVYGGPGDNTWVVYSYHATLSLIAQGGDNTFQVRAFQVINSDNSLSPNIDSALTIDGGTGHSSLLAVGTSSDEQFAISPTRVLGAGLNISYIHLVRVEVNGDGGNDVFTVLGTVAGAVTLLDGGISGNDTFNVGGDIVGSVIAVDAGGQPVLATPYVNGHQTATLAGPLLVNGSAVPPPPLVAGVPLPTEVGTALPPRATQQADPNKVNTLNVFDDGNTTGQRGSLAPSRATRPQPWRRCTPGPRPPACRPARSA